MLMLWLKLAMQRGKWKGSHRRRGRGLFRKFMRKWTQLDKKMRRIDTVIVVRFQLRVYW
jgi:hypothetical protein